ncbi:putative ubiquinol-cytochrome c reductase complex 7.3 kda protein, partial [Kockovaella imperatae]
QQPIYNTIFKRNPVFVSSVFLAAFGFSIGYDLVTSAWWDRHNKGKQWKDIRSRYIEQSGGDDE